MESMVELGKDELLNNTSQHKLYDNWTMWAHLPHDTDWSESSYKNIITLETIEEFDNTTNYGVIKKEFSEFITP